MKLRLLLITFFIVPLFTQSYHPIPDDTKQFVIHCYYCLQYNSQEKQADWVHHLLTFERCHGDIDRDDDFRPDPQIKNGPSLDDYSKSGYDRGHLCPAADNNWSSQAMSESFLLSNMSPQTPSFNRGIWQQVESLVRNWTNFYDTLYVTTGPIFKNNIGFIGRNKITIPGFYYKAILGVKDREYSAVGFILANEKSDLEPFNFAVSIDKIEEETGINFFPQLPEQLQEEIESTFIVDEWPTDLLKNIKKEKKLGVSVQCSGITKSGNPCKRMTKNENGFCFQHQSQVGKINTTKNDPLAKKPSSEQVQCKATTKSGEQCKRFTTNQNGLCWQHQETENSTPQKETSEIRTNTDSREIMTGPRGGKYYINSSGKKVYIKKK